MSMAPTMPDELSARAIRRAAELGLDPERVAVALGVDLACLPALLGPEGRTPAGASSPRGD